MADVKAGNSRYPLMTKKQKYLDQNGKSSAATQFQDRPSVNKFSTISKWSYRISNTLCKTNRSITVNQNEITGTITKPCEKDSGISKMLYQLVKEQSTPSVDTEVFNGDPAHCTYFRSIF